MPGSVVVIGLGQVGSRLAVGLADRGVDVVAIDRRRDMVEPLRDRVALAVALDSTDEAAIQQHLPENVRAAMVCIGNNFEASILTTAILKQLKIRRVITRAQSPIASVILSRIGADETFNPEEESADRWANRIAAPRFLNQIEFHEGYSLVEIATPEEWVGRTLADLRLRAGLGLHVVALKHPKSDDPSAGDRVVMPRPDSPLRRRDVLILMGKDEDIAKVPQKPAE